MHRPTRPVIAAGTQLKHLRRAETGRDQWLRSTVTVDDEEPRSRLARVMDLFECLRTMVWREDTTWLSATLTTEEAMVRAAEQDARTPDAGFLCSRYQVEGRELHVWVHHSVADVLALDAIATAVGGSLPEHGVMQPADLRRLQTNARSEPATRHWQKFHELKRWPGRDPRAASMRSENWGGSIMVPGLPVYDALAASAAVSLPSFFMAECARAAADVCAMREPSVMTVFSNETALRGRTPGACLADDVFFVAPDHTSLPDARYRAAFHHQAVMAYRYGLYDFSELEQCDNYLAAEPNFYRDVTAFMFDARSTAITPSQGKLTPFATSMDYARPDVHAGGAYALSLLTFEISIFRSETHIRCTTRLDEEMVSSTLTEIARRLQSHAA